MPKTSAQYQREQRQRQARRPTGLQADNASLRTELASVRAELEAALAECERLAAMAYRHPAGAVDSGTCRACAAEVW